MMRRFTQAVQIGLTYIGTIVGAGFATGQEILQFFTIFGARAIFGLVVASFLFIWLGTKMMELSFKIKARSYEDLNTHLFGHKAGKWISNLMLVILISITAVMLAGSGSVFVEHFHLSYQLGLLLTLMLSYYVISRGVKGIFAVNSIIVPLVLIFTALLLIHTLNQPLGTTAWWSRSTEPVWWRAVTAPFLYVGFNLVLSQAVLVPIGAAAWSRNVIRLGGLIGGLGIGFMLWSGHVILSAHMPGIVQFEIPMAVAAKSMGMWTQVIFLLLILSEIFTTLIANVFGLSLQIKERLNWSRSTVIIMVLFVCYGISQIGFSKLISTLYPLIGIASLAWLILLMRKRTQTIK